MREYIEKVVMGRDLSESEMVEAVRIIAGGEASGAQIGAFLAGLRMKGETIDEIAGAARVMREKCDRVPVADTGGVLVDTAGTGGDGLATFNVSTTAAFVAAGAGLKVAKHGNRSISSRSGSADVMEALSVNLELTTKQVGRCVDEVGIGFLFAPKLHSAMKYVIGPRREMGVRTIFNVLGPLTNPAGADVQIVGVYDPRLTDKLAGVLGRLGGKGACVVHGECGCDEVSITGPTRISRLKDGDVETFVLSPEDVGLERATLEDIRGGDANENAAITRAVLEGKPGPQRDMVLLNTAPLLVAAGLADDFSYGVAMAGRVIDSGAALEKLDALVEMTNDLAGPVREAM